MREVTAVDSAGRELLDAIHRAGAHLIVKGVWMAGLIEEIAGEQPSDGSKRQRRRKNLPQGKDSSDLESE